MTVKSDNYYINRILESIETILYFTIGKDVDDLQNDIMLNNTVLFQFMLIGEYATKISESYKQAHSNIKWSQIKGFRNIVVHDYFDVEYNVVYDIINIDLLKLKKELKNEI